MSSYAQLFLLSLLLLFCHQKSATSTRKGVKPVAPPTAAEKLRHASTLTPADIKALINDFDRPENRRSIEMSRGLVTGHSRETDVLLSHAGEAYPDLLHALTDSRIHVRRYAAFCLGEIGKPAAIPSLEHALRDEIRSAGGMLYSEKEEPALAALVYALYRLDKRRLVNLLLTTSFTEEELAVVRRQLAWLLPYGPPCRQSSIRSCMDAWRAYWRVHKHEPDRRLFAE